MKNLNCRTWNSIATGIMIAGLIAGGGLTGQDSAIAATHHSASSGQPMPVGDIPGWHQIFTDDFETNVPVGGFSGCDASKGRCSGLPSDVQAKWFAYPDGWPDTSKNGTYYPSKVMSIANGMMNLHLHTENGMHMVSAPVPILPGATGSGGGLLHGRYVIRFQATSVPGYKTAWLLWPDSEVWPRDGEIDFPEGDLNSTIGAFMHRQNGTSGGDQDGYSTQSTYTSWHTAVIEWLPDRLTLILDGQTIGNSTDRIPNTPMHWVIQTETSLSGVTPSDDAVGDVQIDWVAVYVPSDTFAPAPAPTSVPIPTPTPAPVSPTSDPTAAPVSIIIPPTTSTNSGAGDLQAILAELQQLELKITLLLQEMSAKLGSAKSGNSTQVPSAGEGATGTAISPSPVPTPTPPHSIVPVLRPHPFPTVSPCKGEFNCS